MSKIIRHAQEAPGVFIGQQQVDQATQDRSEKLLRAILPHVEVLTDVSGAKLIPIREISKISSFVDKERDQASRRSHQTGSEEGHRRGLAQGLAKAEEVLKQFDQAIKAAVEQREVMLVEAKQKILELVMQISRKVTFDAVDADPECTAAMINGVIDTLSDRSRLAIKVNPNHLPIIEQHRDDFLKGHATIKEISFVADPRVKYGGCFIETPTGDIDARLDSQLDVIGELLVESEAP